MLGSSPNLLLLAIGFANAAILGWLAAAAAPILIHLWMKRVRRETEWAAVRFLRKAIERHSRRLKLREWLLLAVRTAILLCVVLAAAKPVLEGLGLAGPGVRTHYLLVIDGSLSMRYRPGEGPASRLDEAKRLAAGLVRDGRPGDVYSLISMTQPPRLVVGQPVSDRRRIQQAIGSLEPTDGAARLDATLAMAEELLGRVREQTEHVDRHEVVVFSDLARHTWGAAEAGRGEGDGPLLVESSSAAGRIASLAESAEVSVIDLGRDGGSNASIERVELREPLPTSGRPLRLAASARLHAPLNADAGFETTAELLVNGVPVASKPVRLTPGGAATIDFAPRFDRPGAHAIEVRLGGDRLPADNSGWLGLTLPERTRVLCVAGGPGAARNIAGALRPFAEAGEEPALEPVVLSDAELASVDFRRFQAVFFCNVAQVGAREAGRIEAYVRGGGGVAFFLGDRVVPEAYNRLLGGRDAARIGDAGGPGDRPPRLRLVVAGTTDERRGLLPVTLGPSVASSSPVIDPLGYRHPIVQPFEGRERAGLLTTPVARYWRLRVDPGAEDAGVAFATTSGDPLLVTSSFGRGRVAVVATAGSLASVVPATGEPWTAMPAWPSFLPIVRGLLNDLAGHDRRSAAPVVGDPIAGLFPPTAGGIEVLRPDDKRAAVTPAGDGGWSYDQTDRAGVYAVRPSGSVEAFSTIGVNVAPSESDLTRVAPNSLPPGVAIRRAPSRGGAGAALAGESGLHRSLLLAALVLVFLETAMAYWFGRAPA